MNRYFSTFISGLGDVVKEQLSKDLDNFHTVHLFDGLIIYESSSNVQAIKKLSYLNNSFLLIEKFDSLPESNPLEYMVKQLHIENANSLQFFGSSFRLMFYLANQPSSVSKLLLSKIEKKISDQYKLRVDRTSPDQEFWFLYRTEGFGLFGLRFTRHPDWKKVLLKGQLRPELSKLLTIISEPSSEDVVLDPFAGSGAITLERKLLLHKKIISGDIKPLNREILKIDALNMEDKVLSESVNKIITDPPWGITQGKELDLQNFYKRMLDEFIRVLKIGGLAIILMGKNVIFENILNDNQKFKQIIKYDILVSGKKASIYKLIRLK